MFFVTKRMQYARSVYIGDSDNDIEERFDIDDAVFLANYGIDIAGMYHTSTGGWGIKVATPPSVDNARAVLTQGYTYTVIKGELKSLSYVRGEGPFKIVVGDIATSVGALAFPYELCKHGMVIIMDNRVKKVHNRWLSDNISSLNIKVDVSAVTEDDILTKLYASTPASYIIDTKPDARNYFAEARVNYGKVEKEVYFDNPGVHDFYLKRNKASLMKELSKMKRENNNTNSCHNITAVDYDYISQWMQQIKSGDYVYDRMIDTALNRLKYFVKLPDHRIRSYYAAGGRDKDIVGLYCDIMTEYMYDIEKAREVGELYLDTTKRMPYHDYMKWMDDILKLLHSGYNTRTIASHFGLRGLGGRNDMRRKVSREG